MEAMFILGILLGVYIISVVWARYETHLWYMTEVKNLAPGEIDLLLVFLPYVNTMYALTYFADRKLKSKKETRKTFASKFFNIDRRKR